MTKRYTETQINEFLGYLTAAVPELHNKHPQEMLIQWEAYLAAKPPEPKVVISPLAPSGELFNALMAHYGNTARAVPTDSISKTMQQACRNEGLFDEKPVSRIIQG